MLRYQKINNSLVWLGAVYDDDRKNQPLIARAQLNPLDDTYIVLYWPYETDPIGKELAVYASAEDAINDMKKAFEV